MTFLADYFHYIAEEIGNASVVVPRSMLSSVILNGILGFSMLVTVLFSAGDYEQAVNSPTQYPFIEIIAQAVGSNKGATAIVRLSAPRFKVQKANKSQIAIIISAMIFATVGLLATALRMTWAFAREEGVPASAYLSRVSSLREHRKV